MPEEATLPLHFANALSVNSAFPLPANKARALLPDPAPVNLVEVFPGRAVLVVSFALYRESPFGTYAEAVLALMASHERVTPVMTLARLTQESRYPAYVLHMFVNNAQAQPVGTDWGLPRVLATVDIAEQGERTTCAVALEGQPVMQVEATRPRTERTRHMQIETYSQQDSTLWHAVMRCDAAAYGRTQGEGVAIQWGAHPIGQQLAAAGVSPQPLMLRYYDQMQAELSAPAACNLET